MNQYQNTRRSRFGIFLIVSYVILSCGHIAQLQIKNDHVVVTDPGENTDLISTPLIDTQSYDIIEQKTTVHENSTCGGSPVVITSERREALPVSHMTEETEECAAWVYDIDKITMESGICYGPSGKETYYNLPMDGVVYLMRNLGYSETEYPYWVRDDGVKMFGPYIMVAADLRLRPKGTIIETSLGTGIVCDTGEFAYKNRKQLDIAVTW